jgi:hypothetical protein
MKSPSNASMNLNRDSGVEASDAAQVAEPVADPCANEPVMIRFRAALLEIQARELKRLYDRLPHLDAYSRGVIQQSAESIVKNVLRPPAELLHDETANHHGLREALQRLFQLDDETGPANSRLRELPVAHGLGQLHHRCSPAGAPTP